MAEQRDYRRVAHQSGAKLVIVNRDPTDQDRLADLVLHAGIGRTLLAIAEETSRA